MYCGILLAQAGHSVTIFEASVRAGGRILTYRDPQNPSLYMGDLGAMRFLLDVQFYMNTLIRQRYKLNVTEFINSNDDAYVYINDIRATFREFNENPDIFKFNTSQSERGKVRFLLMINSSAKYIVASWHFMGRCYSTYFGIIRTRRMAIGSRSMGFVFSRLLFEHDQFVTKRPRVHQSL